MRSLGLLLSGALLLSACGGGEKAGEPLPEAGGKLTLTSPAFRNGDTLPRRYSCDGPGPSPPLTWSPVPVKTRELVLLVEDPDADRFQHWTVLAIPRAVRRFAEGQVPRGAVETDNSFGKKGWGAPCPPEGDDPHHYVFALYASDRILDLDEGSSPDDVREQLADHGIARGELTVTYGRD